MERMENIYLETVRTCTFIFDRLLSILIPPDAVISAIENMSPTEFLEETRSAPGRKAYEADIAIFPYRSRLAKAALVELKERRNMRIAKLLGKILFDALATEVERRGWTSLPTVLIPVPISKKKRRERGWNQCDLILEGLAEAASDAGHENLFEVRLDILRKILDAGDQVGRSREKRIENVSGCFAIADEGAIRGKDVIIVDDIVTTGATLKETARMASEAGARSVVLAALAY